MHVIANPRGQLRFAEPAGGERHHLRHNLIIGRDNFVAIEAEKNGCRKERDPFVTIAKRMVPRQSVRVRRREPREIWLPSIQKSVAR